jgi:hypothetical protein
LAAAYAVSKEFDFNAVAAQLRPQVPPILLSQSTAANKTIDIRLCRDEAGSGNGTIRFAGVQLSSQ